MQYIFFSENMIPLDITIDWSKYHESEYFFLLGALHLPKRARLLQWLVFLPGFRRKWKSDYLQYQKSGLLKRPSTTTNVMKIVAKLLAKFKQKNFSWYPPDKTVYFAKTNTNNVWSNDFVRQ